MQKPSEGGKEREQVFNLLFFSPLVCRLQNEQFSMLELARSLTTPFDRFNGAVCVFVEITYETFSHFSFLMSRRR